MRETLKSFTSQSLEAASDALLKRLGIRYTPFIKGVTFDDYFEKNDFSYQYVSEANKCISHIWNIGYVNEETFQNGASRAGTAKYDSISIFACEIRLEANFRRGVAVDLTRAFNRVSSRSVNFEYDMPVIVIMRQGSLLSVATCERTEKQNGIGEKVGKVTILRNMDCDKLHAGHRQILERIANDVSGCASYEELHQKWFKSFNIDVLSDSFFNGYKEIYEDIIEYITGKRMVKESGKWVEKDNHEPCTEIMSEFDSFDNPEKAVRDYVKNLMGRLVFIQFLQKKGWMGVPSGDSWEGGDAEFLQNLFANSDKKETFVDDVLEPLFNDLNTKRHGDLVTNQNVGVNIKVPYLNGGLFELDESDDTMFPLPSRFLKELFDFFASYNFTIDENAPDDVEIGVDPEMLGRIFENLLEDNKEKGAFYTPKEIVQYMCRESLIAYLTTCVMKKQGANHKPEEDIREAVRRLLSNPEDIVPKMSSEQLNDFGAYIRKVKICDPAIGSGAFPMGLLNELVRCRKTINAWAKDAYGNPLPGDIAALKAEIICNNIYGVDIERGAIDIARLRFWLSIIVDLKTPQALPNFDYKFMQGNSLITTFNGEYVNLDTKSQGHTRVREMDKEKRKLYDFKQQYYGSQGVKKHELAVEIKKSILRLVSMQIGYELRSWYLNNMTDGTIIYEEQEFNFAEVKKKLPLEKKKLVDYAQSLYNQLNDKDVDIAKRALIDIHFFDWRIMFTEVFDVEGGNGGFDIVIGNPPYIRQERLGMAYKTLLTSVYPSVGNGTADILVYFFGLGFEIMKKNAVLTFITSNKYLKTLYGKELRYTLTNDVTVTKIIDFFELPVFNAATDAAIIDILNKKTEIETKYFPMYTLENLDLEKRIQGCYKLTIKKDSEWQFVDPNEYSLLAKIQKDTITLEEFTNGRIYYGIKTGCNKAFVLKNTADIQTLLNSESRPIIRRYASGTDIKKWNINNSGQFFIATGFDIDIEKEYPSAYAYLNRYKDLLESRSDKGVKYYNLRACTYYDVFDHPKIIYIRTAKNHYFYLDTDGYYVNDSCYIIDSDSRFLVAFLNSKLFDYYKRIKFVAYGDGQNAGRCKLEYNKMVTICIKTNVDEKPYEKLVDNLLALKKNNPQADPTVLESEIDQLVYKLYDLTPEEIAIVENSAK